MSRCTVTVSSPSAAAAENSVTGDAFWDRIVERLHSARSGATVVVNAGNRLDIPTALLEELDGTNNTLLIHWSGRDISLDGRDLDALAFDRDSYALRTLSGLYGISDEEEREFDEEDWDDFEFEELPEELYFEDDEPAAPVSKKKPAAITENETEPEPPAASTPQNSTPQNPPAQSGGSTQTTAPQGGGTAAAPSESVVGESDAPDEPAPTTDEIDMTPVEGGEDTLPSSTGGEENPVLAPAAQEEPKQRHWGILAIAGSGVLVVGSAATAVCLRIRSKNRWDDVPF